MPTNKTWNDAPNIELGLISTLLSPLMFSSLELFESIAVTAIGLSLLGCSLTTKVVPVLIGISPDDPGSSVDTTISSPWLFTIKKTT